MPENLTKTKTAADLPVGAEALLKDLRGPENYLRRLHELGFISGAEIFCINRISFGGPILFKTGNVTVALRREEAECLIL